MNRARAMEEIADMLVLDAAHDHLALYLVSGAVRSELSLLAVEDYKDKEVCDHVKEVTLQVVSLMLARGARAITLMTDRPGYTEWDSQEPEHVLNRISREWDTEKWARIGRDPDPGEVVWFL